MARLINADELIAWFENHSVYDEFPVGYIMGLIDEQPTVDAIPVEWIEEYMNNHMLKFSDRWMAMDWMLNDWRKENGQTD